MPTNAENAAPPTAILPDAEFQELLRAMRQEYGRMLPVKVSELESVWDMLLQEEWNTERLGRFIRLAHSLAGSAGSYGYPHVGEQARALELYAKGTLGDTPPPPDQIRAVSALITALHVDNNVWEQGAVAQTTTRGEDEHQPTPPAQP